MNLKNYSRLKMSTQLYRSLLLQLCYRILLFQLCCSGLLFQPCYSSQPQVSLQQGTVRGLHSTSVSGRRFSTFVGIPYAKPPVGKHRLKDPAPPEPWIGLYNATRPPPSCLQMPHFNIPISVLGSEDCLYLNVYTPQTSLEDSTKQGRKPLDVIAFIHGGAFMFLTSSVYGGSILLDRDVVLVTISYRLGPLGFLSTGDAAAPGNFGMKDQVQALRWIQENIAAFGGNPDSVTISGFSAGGASVHYHVLSPLSRGLFKAAICASGTSLNPWTVAENSREKAIHLARELGCPVEDSFSMVKCLRNRPAEHIVEFSRNFMPWLYNPFSPYAPVVEPPGPNAFLPDYPMNILSQGSAADVPILFTYTKEEGLYPGADIVSKPDYLKDLNNRWDQIIPFVLDYNNTAPCQKTRDEISKKIKERYRVDLNTEEGIENFIQLLGDRIFVHGIAKTVRLHASLYTSPVYLYRFSYSGKYTISTKYGATKELGVCHADDILYVMSVNGMSTHETERDRRMSNDMVDLWVSFAAEGKLDAPTIGEHLPKIFFTDIQGPNQTAPTLVEELGEERFWDSLGLLENVEGSGATHEEL